jgi:hypothetical protein
MRYHRQSSLHGVTLPRSWLLAELDHLEVAGTKDTGLYGLFVEPMAELLDQIYIGVQAGTTSFSLCSDSG